MDRMTECNKGRLSKELEVRHGSESKWIQKL